MKEVSISTKIIAMLITVTGVYLIIKGDTTNGLLAMILGEVAAIPKLEKD